MNKLIALASLLALTSQACAYAVGTLPPEQEDAAPVVDSDGGVDGQQSDACVGITFHCSGAQADGGLACSLVCIH